MNLTGERPMQTGEDRVRFTVSFVQLNLDELRPGDWLNLRDDLEAFLRGGGRLKDHGGLLAVAGAPGPKEMSEKALRDLQADMRSLLAGLADADEAMRRDGQHTLDSIRIAVRY